MAQATLKPCLTIKVWPSVNHYAEEMKFEYKLSDNLQLHILHKEDCETKVQFMDKDRQITLTLRTWEDILAKSQEIKALVFRDSNLFESVHVKSYIVSKLAVDRVYFISETSTESFTMSRDEMEMFFVTKDEAERMRKEDFIGYSKNRASEFTQ